MDTGQVGSWKRMKEDERLTWTSRRLRDEQYIRIASFRMLQQRGVEMSLATDDFGQLSCPWYMLKMACSKATSVKR